MSLELSSPRRILHRSYLGTLVVLSHFLTYNNCMLWIECLVEFELSLS